MTGSAAYRASERSRQKLDDGHPYCIQNASTEAILATLTIKKLPDSLYQRLKAKAAEHRRSLNSEAILAVERAVADTGSLEPGEIVASLRNARARLTRVFVTDSALRAGRRDGRA
jgi:plasmid stability protein